MGREGIGFIANLDPEQRVRYYYWWRKYLLLKYVSRAALLLCAACLLAPLADKSLRPVAAHAAKPAFYISIASGIWWVLLECPRCGQKYRWGGELDYFGDDCQNCGLTEAQLSSVAKPH
jgi:hypothetical protein